MNVSALIRGRPASLALGILLLAGTPLAWATWWMVTAAEAASCVGHVCTVEGKVVNVTTSRNNTTVINLGEAAPEFTAVIAPDAAAQFHDVQTYAGHKVRITGLVKMHRGHPEATLDHPSQLAAAE